MLTLIFRALIPQAKLLEAGSLKEGPLNGGESSSQLVEPTPTGHGGRLPDPLNHPLLVEPNPVDVGPPRVLIFVSAGRNALQQSVLEERHLHIAGEDVVTQEPTFALDAIERRIPPRTLVRFRQRTHDEVIESAPDIAFPARHGRDVGLHKDVAVGLRDRGCRPKGEPASRRPAWCRPSLAYWISCLPLRSLQNALLAAESVEKKPEVKV